MDIYGKTVLELAEMLKEKKVSSKELFDYFKGRIEKLNPVLNAIITVSDDEKSVKQDNTQGFFDNKGMADELAGIPLIMKDNFCTNGLRTTAASEVLENFVPQYNATVTERLLMAGVKVLGKANMDAWAHGSSGETSQFGPTKNPWNLDTAPGGSSSGSAAAVAAYMSPAAIGSETAGSTRLPASWTGLVGFKPTYGRVSRYGVAAMGSSLDSPGPLTLSVKDAALIVNAIAGNDRYDATSTQLPQTDYLKSIDPEKKFKIGVPKSYFEGCTPAVEKSIYDAIEVYKKLGHTVVDVDLMDPNHSVTVYTIVQRAEVASNLSRFQGIRYGLGREKFGREAKKRSMLGSYTVSSLQDENYYREALKLRTLIIQDFAKVFEEVDLIISPVAPITAIKLGEFEKYSYFGELMDKLNEPSSIAGLPGISIPSGLDENEMPIGMQLIAKSCNEQAIFDAAYAYERETDFNGVIKKGLEKWKNIEL